MSFGKDRSRGGRYEKAPKKTAQKIVKESPLKLVDEFGIVKKEELKKITCIEDILNKDYSRPCFCNDIKDCNNYCKGNASEVVDDLRKLVEEEEKSFRDLEQEFSHDSKEESKEEAEMWEVEKKKKKESKGVYVTFGNGGSATNTKSPIQEYINQVKSSLYNSQPYDDDYGFTWGDPKLTKTEKKEDASTDKTDSEGKQDADQVGGATPSL